jgi:N6-L-threonylcarbamoyladenine synthase
VQPSSHLACNSLVLGIETSCDETAAAVVAGGRDVLANVIASQIATHALYGGVVPEIASREHLRQIVPVVREALRNADATLDDICAVAVTEGPGLAGALFVGISYAKALAFSAGKPLIAVNHLEGHIHSALMTADGDASDAAPVLALVVSGGHTHLYLATREAAAWSYRNVGRTVDDAAGEAFDKTAKMLGLGYPGGPWIAALAAHGNPRAVPFSFAQVKAKAHLRNKFGKQSAGASRRNDSDADAILLSFSGIKTAVARHIELHGMAAAAEERRRVVAANPSITPEQLLPLCNAQALDLAASFQHAVVEDLVRKTLRATERFGARKLLITGGVAANLQLRKRFSQEAAARGLQLAFPAPGLSTDNAAMIAAAAWPKFLAGNFAPPDLTAQPAMRL